jgi:hypothetical protein
MGTSMEDFTLHEFDTPLNPARVSKSLPYEMTAPNCGFMLPMVSLLEQFVGSYCDSVCADQVMASKDKNVLTKFKHRTRLDGKFLRTVPIASHMSCKKQGMETNRTKCSPTWRPG